ncbi:hypothetical protein [Coleofasciculus sp.]|uniref:hypothetical protein n=1 Tax=Coleofasciculus sp. TaxID=3100458 RepID=UPI003A41F27A
MRTNDIDAQAVSAWAKPSSKSRVEHQTRYSGAGLYSMSLGAVIPEQLVAGGAQR